MLGYLEMTHATAMQVRDCACKISLSVAALAATRSK